MRKLLRGQFFGDAADGGPARVVPFAELLRHEGGIYYFAYDGKPVAVSEIDVQYNRLIPPDAEPLKGAAWLAEKVVRDAPAVPR